jgi:hypothetical protein
MNKLGEYLSYGWHRCTMRSSLSWMCTNVFNLLVRLKKCVDSDWVSCWFDTATNIVKEKLPSSNPSHPQCCGESHMYDV